MVAFDSTCCCSCAVLMIAVVDYFNETFLTTPPTCLRYYSDSADDLYHKEVLRVTQSMSNVHLSPSYFRCQYQ
jgi:hypothetical protein